MTSAHPRTVDVITMGCSKNLVDSEHLLRQLREKGFQAYHNPEHTHGDIVVVNTCGFIGDAKEESINMILSLCEEKAEGNLKRVYVMGCLSERYFQELAQEIPQVDRFFGKFNWSQLLEELGEHYEENLRNERVLTTPSHYAYLKISEGCDRKCAYCAIPIITGGHVSRPMEEILDEVRMLVRQGVTEFQVIAQEQRPGPRANASPRHPSRNLRTHPPVAPTSARHCATHHAHGWFSR